MKLKAIAAAAVLALAAGAALAKLPPPTDEQKAQAAAAKAKADYAAKLDAYKLCVSMDRVSAHYYADMKAKGKEVKPEIAAPACQDPGPFEAAAPPSATAAAAAPAKPPADAEKK